MAATRRSIPRPPSPTRDEPPSPHRVSHHRSRVSGSSPLPFSSTTPLAPQFPNQGLGGPPQACFNLGCPRAAFTQWSALKPESLRGCLGPGRGGEALPGACEEGWVGWESRGEKGRGRGPDCYRRCHSNRVTWQSRPRRRSCPLGRGSRHTPVRPFSNTLPHIAGSW